MKAFGQNAAYYPDSTSTAFDKQNLRDGHCTLWSSTVHITKLDSPSTPTNPAVRTLTNLVLGNPLGVTDAVAPIDGLADVVNVALVPDCAMRVTRSTDGGNLSPYSPAAPCSCYYLSKIAGASGGPAGCKPCAAGAECADPGAVCSHGYCESATVSASDAGAAVPHPIRARCIPPESSAPANGGRPPLVQTGILRELEGLGHRARARECAR